MRLPDVLGTRVSQTYRATLHGSEEFPVFKSGILLAFRRTPFPLRVSSFRLYFRVRTAPALLRVRPGERFRVLRVLPLPYSVFGNYEL